MHTISVSLTADVGGRSQKIAISTMSAQSTALAVGSVVVTPSVDCFMRAGVNPTAVSDGTDQFLLGNNTYRITISPGVKLAFITLFAGFVYITPEA